MLKTPSSPRWDKCIYTPNICLISIINESIIKPRFSGSGLRWHMKLPRKRFWVWFLSWFFSYAPEFLVNKSFNFLLTLSTNPSLRSVAVAFFFDSLEFARTRTVKGLGVYNLRSEPSFAVTFRVHSRSFRPSTVYTQSLLIIIYSLRYVYSSTYSGM